MLCGPHVLDDEMSMKQIFLMYWFDKVCVMFYIVPPFDHTLVFHSDVYVVLKTDKF